jgi:transcription initiation factor IIE alpha subunit
MSRCPKCGNDISDIVIRTNKQQTIYLHITEEGNLELEGEENLDERYTEGYYCPVCRERLYFNNVNEAKDFLKKGKSETKKGTE